MENQDDSYMQIPLEECGLYMLDIPRLLSNVEVCKHIFELLSDVSEDQINEETLRSLASNPRNQIYVLLGPVESWNVDGLTAYSVIQVCVEGKIEGVPDLSGEIDKFSECFFMFPRLRELFGVNIVKVFAKEQPCASMAVQLLARYHNGDGAEDASVLVPQLEGRIFSQLQRRTWPPLVHYVGVLIKLNVVQLDHWTSNGFSPIFIGRLISEERKAVCAMIKWLNDYDPRNYYSEAWLFSICRCAFTKYLGYSLTSSDHSFALRILNMPLVNHISIPLKEKPWSEVDDRIIVAFIGGQAVPQELVDYQIRTVAELYFDRLLLPISLSEVDQSVLLLCGLQRRGADEIMRIMNISEKDLKQSTRRLLEKAFDYVNPLFPQVLDVEDTQN